jgi:acetyl-CoA carboxylase biotin carboxyl carrier protein
VTEYDADLDAIEEAARSLVPELSRRVNELGLGELEVRRGSMRLKVGARQGGARTVDAALPTANASGTAADSARPAAGEDDGPSTEPVVSPAVGIFVYADGLGRGTDVTPGQTVGHVDMLGVRHDVRAQRAGRVASLVSESGEPVEYGQLLLEIEADEVARK